MKTNPLAIAVIAGLAWFAGAALAQTRTMTKFFTAVAQTLTVGALLAHAASVVAQQDYPNRPIRFIVPFSPGGNLDPVARLVSQKLSERLREQVIVDNRPGGGGSVGTEVAVKSKPDGYTLLLHGDTLLINANLLPLRFDPIKDLAAVATLISTERVLAVHPSLPVNNLREFIALARVKPGQLNYASAGSGTGTHLTAELFNNVAGVKIQHIPYKGSGPAIIDLISGQVHMSFQTPISVIGHIKRGRLKGLSISGENRLPSLPQMPTFVEGGIKGFDVRIWFGILAPTGIPKEIIDKLSSEAAGILTNSDFEEKLLGQGLKPFISTPDQFAALMKADFAKFGKIIKDAGIKLDN